MATDINPQLVVVTGRLSYPAFTMGEATSLNERSNPTYKKKPEDVKPSFNILVEQAALDKVVAHIRNHLLPWAEAQYKADPTKNNGGLEPKWIKQITRILDAGDWETEGVFGFIKSVPEKTQELAPEAVANIKVNGFKGRDVERKVLVRDESQLLHEHSDIIVPSKGIILPERDTQLEVYPGGVVSTQVNMFTFVSGQTAGISASAGTVVLVGDAPRFGGGDIDEDAIFMDLAE